jgi:hypothetical protein
LRLQKVAARGRSLQPPRNQWATAGDDRRAFGR